MEDILCCFPTREDQKPKVTIANGKMVGQIKETAKGVDYVSFTCIPFAQPPIGHLRFRRPVPKEPWSHVLDATKKSPHPIHYNFILGNKEIGQEDCLYLNVYSPDLPMTRNQNKLPVMVWFFGTTFSMGTSRDDIFGPDRFMNTGEVVLVTANYRLGPFGFLNLGIESCPGNQGLWDQVQALKWVHDNISEFGGDPDNVTLVGHGSGSVCASYHLISKQSVGLFARIILMSGNLATPGLWLHHDPVEVAKTFAKELGIDEEEPDLIFEELQSKSASDLLEESGVLKDWDFLCPNPWLPSVDMQSTKDPFLRDEPMVLLKNGAVNKMPVMIGHAKDEGILYGSRLIQDPSNIKYLDQHWNALASLLLFNKSDENLDEEEKNDEEKSKALERIRSQYFGEKSVDDLKGVIEMLSDAYGACANALLVNLIKEASAQPVFLYSFDYKGKFRAGDLISTNWKSVLTSVALRRMSLKPHEAENHGICQGDELIYLFRPKIPGIHDGIFLTTPSDVAISEKMVRMWVNFSRFSNPTPNPKDDPTLKELLWKPYNEQQNGPYLAISKDCMTSNHEGKQLTNVEFWSDIYQDYSLEKTPCKVYAKLFRKRFKLKT